MYCGIECGRNACIPSLPPPPHTHCRCFWSHPTGSSMWLQIWGNEIRGGGGKGQMCFPQCLLPTILSNWISHRETNTHTQEGADCREEARGCRMEKVGEGKRHWRWWQCSHRQRMGVCLAYNTSFTSSPWCEIRHSGFPPISHSFSRTVHKRG